MTTQSTGKWRPLGTSSSDGAWPQANELTIVIEASACHMVSLKMPWIGFGFSNELAQPLPRPTPLTRVAQTPSAKQTNWSRTTDNPLHADYRSFRSAEKLMIAGLKPMPKANATTIGLVRLQATPLNLTIDNTRRQHPESLALRRQTPFSQPRATISAPVSRGYTFL
jgi:hypothetical protein